MNKRLEQFIKAEALTSAKFAEILSVQPSSISHLLSGRNKPNFDFISNLLSMFPNLNPKWIINGEGEMYLTSIKHTEEHDVSNIVKVNDVNVESSVAEEIEFNSTDKEQVSEITDVINEGLFDNQQKEVENTVTNVTECIQPNENQRVNISDLKEELLSDLLDMLNDEIISIKENISSEISTIKGVSLNLAQVDQNVEADKSEVQEVVNDTPAVEQSSNSVAPPVLDSTPHDLNNSNMQFTTLKQEQRVVTQVMLFYSDGTFETFKGSL